MREHAIQVNYSVFYAFEQGYEKAFISNYMDKFLNA